MNEDVRHLADQIKKQLCRYSETDTAELICVMGLPQYSLAFSKPKSTRKKQYIRRKDASHDATNTREVL